MKSLRMLSLVKFSVRYACLGLALAAAISSHAATFTNTLNATSSPNNWSLGAGWSLLPVSASDTTLIYTGPVAANAAIVSTNDIAGNFLLNPLSITNNGAGAGTQTLLISGNSLEFVNDGGTAPTLNFATGTNGPVVTISNNLVLTNNLTLTATTGGTLSGIISGGGNLTKTGSGATVLSNTNTYNGVTSLGTAGSVVSAGITTLSGAGSINTSSAVNVYGAGTRLVLDYTGAAGNAAVNRINNSATVTLGTGGELSLIPNATAATNTSESVGGLTIDTGNATLTAFTAAAPAGQLNAFAVGSTGFARSNNATALIRGTSLGTLATAASRVTINGTAGTGLTLVGTTTSISGAGTSGTDKQLTIVPYFIGASTAAGVGTNFLTYDTNATTGGLRLLATNEQSLISTTAVTNDNVKTVTGANAVSAGAKVFNSLLNAGTVANTITGAGGLSDSLTLTSGALASVATTAAGTLNITGFSSIIFGTAGANEAVITNTNVTAGGSLAIDSAINTAIAGGGLTKTGAGVVILSAGNLYTGATTINQGALQVGNGTAGSLNASSIVTVTPQGTLSPNLANNGVMTNTIINNGTISKTVGANVNELSGGISGTGVVTVNLSASVLAFSGAGTKTYSGATTVIDGALRAVDNVLSASSALSLAPTTTSNAILQLRANAATTFTVGSSFTILGASSGARNVTIDVGNISSGTNQALTIGGTTNFNNTSNAVSTQLNVTGANGYKLVLANVSLTNAQTNSPVIFNTNGADLDISTMVGTSTANFITTYVGSGTTRLGTVTQNTGSRNFILNIGGSASNLFAGGAGPLLLSPGTSSALTGSVTLTGVVSNAGGAASSAALGFNLNSGTLNINNASALGNGVNAQARVLNLAGGTINATAGDINVTDMGTKLTTNINDNFAFGGTNALNLGTGAVTLGAATVSSGTTRTITTGGTTNALTFGGVISNGVTATDITKAGAGTLIFGGANVYTGQTTVNGGTLLVNNATGSGLGSGNAVVGIAGKLGGTGSFSGSVTVNTGGTLAPGASIQTLGSGTVSLNTGSTFAYEVDSGVALGVGADLQKVTGDLNLSGTVTLTFADLNSIPTPFALGTTFTLINYSGSWNNGLLTYNAATVADGAIFNTGLNLWELDYNATTGGSNFSGEYAGANFVNITAVIPEPSTFLLLAAGGMATLIFRRRRRA